jgi:hypothetical protein
MANKLKREVLKLTKGFLKEFLNIGELEQEVS